MCALAPHVDSLKEVAHARVGNHLVIENVLRTTTYDDQLELVKREASVIGKHGGQHAVGKIIGVIQDLRMAERLATAALTAGPPPSFLKRVLFSFCVSTFFVVLWLMLAHASTCRHQNAADCQQSLFGIMNALILDHWITCTELDVSQNSFETG